MTPFIEVYLPNNDMDTMAKLGAKTNLTTEMVTSVGAVSFDASYTLAGYFYKTPKNIRFTQDGEEVKSSEETKGLNEDLALTEDDDNYLLTARKAPRLKQTVRGAISYEPNVVKGLTMGLSQSHYWDQNPKMELKDKAIELQTNSIGIAKYSSSYERWNTFTADYALSDDLSITNDLHVGGVVEGKRQIQNQLSLTMTMF